MNDPLEKFLECAGYSVDPDVQKLLALVRLYREANQYIQKACLCRDMTKGFDYGEEHRNLGKAGSGQRWVPPRDKIFITEQEARKIIKND